MRSPVKGKLLIMALMMAFLLGNAGADVALDINVYNSQDSLSTSLAGASFDFGSAAILTPTSLLYNGGGKSNNPISHYSYEAALNGEPLGTGARTDSGGFGWSAAVDCNFKGDGSRDFKLGSFSMVKDGTMETYNYNSDHRVEQTITVTNAVYFQNGLIRTETMTSSGKGGTTAVPAPNDVDIEADLPSPDENEAGIIKGVQSVITVTGSKSASIEQDVLGDKDVLWIDRFESDPTGYELGQKIKGVARSPEGSLEMKGEATDFPTQTLPPGEVEITGRIYDPRLEEIYKNFEEEINAFRELYPDASPGLWYYLNQKAYFSPVEEGEPSNPELIPGEYFEMAMQFAVKGE